MKPKLVEMRDVSIAFGGIKAVDRVSVDLDEGEVVALLGHNGAGKSTLIKILSGAYRADSGEIRVRGETVDIASPRDAKRYGIETIYQTLALADNVGVEAFGTEYYRLALGSLGPLGADGREHDLFAGIRA